MKNEVSRKIGSKGSFEELYTFLEVAKIYGMDDSSLRKKVARGKFVVGVDVKKMGRTWIITEKAMVKNFGALKFEEHINNHSEKENMIFNKSSLADKNKKLNSKKNNSKSGKFNKKIFSMNEKEEKSKDSWANGEIKGIELKSFNFNINKVVNGVESSYKLRYELIFVFKLNIFISVYKIIGLKINFIIFSYFIF